MPKINITFEGTTTDLDDFCNHHNYEEDENGTKVQFFIKKVKEFVYNSVRATRVKRASDQVIKTEVEKEISF